MHVAARVAELAGELERGGGMRLDTNLFGRSVCPAAPVEKIVVKRVAVGAYDATGLECGIARGAIPCGPKIHERKPSAHAELLILIYRSRISLVVTPSLIVTYVCVWQESEVQSKAILTETRRQILQQELVCSFVNRSVCRPHIGTVVVSDPKPYLRVGKKGYSVILHVAPCVVVMRRHGN